MKYQNLLSGKNKKKIFLYLLKILPRVLRANQLHLYHGKIFRNPKPMGTSMYIVRYLLFSI